ncbi:MAG: bifunctional 2-polyprenyl-6-hydroxyphenol methylase/3-demethylubiquinol 3-O-methyltransferase UbiG, partial [Alphaproteobacteria bacterium]
RATTAEALHEAGERFDVVLNMEVVEHVASPRRFLRDCAQMVKPGGLMICATLNRTPRSLLMAKFGAEYVLRWLPVGTHTWSKFITPPELERMLIAAGLRITDQTGVTYNPLKDSFALNPRDVAVNYMMVGVQP